MQTTFQIGEKVVLTTRVVRRKRCVKKLVRVGILLAKNDMRAWHHDQTATPEKVAQIMSQCLGFQNATGTSSNGLTQKNNPVLLTTGECVWADADQISKSK